MQERKVLLLNERALISGSGSAAVVVRDFHSLPSSDNLKLRYLNFRSVNKTLHRRRSGTVKSFAT